LEEPVGGSVMTRNVHLVEHNKAHGGGYVAVHAVQCTVHVWSKGGAAKKRNQCGQNDKIYCNINRNQTKEKKLK